MSLPRGPATLLGGDPENDGLVRALFPFRAAKVWRLLFVGEEPWPPEWVRSQGVPAIDVGMARRPPRPGRKD